ncbi:MAG: hypothetical protein KKD90_02610 [Candidatus Omnitrophica bacterium]|nr:hypothetical protein [Candidatus Omnitrophota bacterium]
MQKRDRLFIVLAGLLTILFAYEIYMNISREIFNRPAEISSPQIDVSEVLNKLKEAGLEPKEAKYYKVIDE